MPHLSRCVTGGVFDFRFNFNALNRLTKKQYTDSTGTVTIPTGAATGPVTVAVASQAATGPVFTLTAQIVLLDSLGNSTTYSSQIGAGRWLPTDSQGPACSVYLKDYNFAAAPPSTFMISAVMNRASSEARNSMALATSSA